jgi:PAS domain-containing protein
MTLLLAQPLFVALVAILVAAGIVLATEGWRGRVRLLPAPDENMVMLFDGDSLADATPAARDLLRAGGRSGDRLRDVLTLLAQRFPGIEGQVGAMNSGTDTLRSAVSGDSMVVERWGAMTRLTLHAGGHGDSLRLAAIEAELTTLRAIAEDAPQLVWKTDAGGAVVWANRAYLALADRLLATGQDDAAEWPVQPIFALDGSGRQRLSLTLPESEAPVWYEVTSVSQGGQVVHFGIDATGAVTAEAQRRDFVQTLTKTFAHLRAGLAIFDRRRQLVLFNPAFLDLTGLRADFLSQRPRVQSVLDRLRDMQMLPEPKNYTSWRDQVAGIEAAAEQGTYCETWMLPGGQTYRVSGRPHPDGAIAFIFEDISDEVSLTRRFRMEQETAHAVLDLLPQAVAVFSVAGTMTLCNRAYDRLWGVAGGGLHDAVAAQEIARWRGLSVTSPVWDRITALLVPGGNRETAAEVLQLTDGRMIDSRFTPLPGGSVLVEFHETGAGLPLAMVPETGTLLARTGT